MIFFKAKNHLKSFTAFYQSCIIKNRRQKQSLKQTKQVSIQPFKTNINLGFQQLTYAISSDRFHINSFKSLNMNITHFIATQKDKPSELTKDQKIIFMKTQLQANLTKFNLKSALKILNLLTSFNTQFSEQFKQDVKVKIQTQISSLDEQGIIMLLELFHKQQKKYQRNNRVFRSLNTIIQKGKKKTQAKNLFKILKMITLLNFPKSSIANFISSLVLEQQIKYRQFHLLLSSQLIKSAVVAIQMKQVSLQVKSRILQSVWSTKYQTIEELVYLYHLCLLLPKALSQTAKHQSIIKSVYDIAFNPYSHINNQSKESKPQQQKQSNKQKQNKNSEQNYLQYNKQLLKDKNQQANNLITQFFKKISTQDIIKHIDQRLSNTNNDQMMSLSINTKKQIVFLLITNHFKSKNVKQLIQNIFSAVIDGEGLNIDEFTLLAPQLDNGKDWFLKYKKKYFKFMNLQEKLTLIYHGKKTFDIQINLNQLVQLVQQTSQSLNINQFKILLKIIQNLNKNDAEVKKTVFSLILKVQSKVDNQIQRLKRDRVKQQVKKQTQP